MSKGSEMPESRSKDGGRSRCWDMGRGMVGADGDEMWVDVLTVDGECLGQGSQPRGPER
jgi:hypothetical protein